MDPERTVTFDPAVNQPMDRQFMLSQLVVPRPIAMVSTRSPDGVNNVAPMSYYLPITGDPMLVGITMGLREDGELKHTYLNALASGDFVINVTGEAFRDDIETVAMEGPADVDEFEGGLCGFRRRRGDGRHRVSGIERLVARHDVAAHVAHVGGPDGDRRIEWKVDQIRAPAQGMIALDDRRG